MSADKYNIRQIETGELTPQMVTKLVELWQRDHDLTVDGYAGDNTIASLLDAMGGGPIEKAWPLRCLEDGRKPKITSGFYTENPSRSTHKGVDMFFRWNDDDPDVETGDGGNGIKRKGKRRWWYPPGTVACAAAAGVVQIAGNTKTGWRCWVDHGNGERTGYFHGAALLVKQGDIVALGDPLIVAGDNPSGHDAVHLHFEVSPVDRYAPMNPRKWLEGAKYLPA